jgi:hypothetical protein
VEPQPRNEVSAVKPTMADGEDEEEKEETREEHAAAVARFAGTSEFIGPIDQVGRGAGDGGGSGGAGSASADGGAAGGGELRGDVPDLHSEACRSSR